MATKNQNPIINDIAPLSSAAPHDACAHGIGVCDDCLGGDWVSALPQLERCQLHVANRL